MMDFKKLKGINWVGNIYDKFEAICQEVDDIVNQDTIKYVEAQVQTAGKSVKKLCSNAVQDLLPSLGGHVKHDAQDVAIKDNSTISTTSKENLEESSVDEKQSPTQVNMDFVTSQLSLVSVRKVDEVLGTENSSDATEKQSLTEHNVMDPVTNQLSLVSCKYDFADQLSSPTSVDTLEVPESDLFVGKIDGILRNENSSDRIEKQSPTEPCVMDLVTNELSFVSRKYHLADQPSSPTSDEIFLDAMESQSSTEPKEMDFVTNQLSLVSSDIHLVNQHSSPTSVDALEVLESDLSVGKIDDVLTNENSLDATESQSPTESYAMHPAANQLSLVSSKYHLADHLCSPISMETLEVFESELIVGKIDDSLTSSYSLDATENQTPTEPNIMDPVTNQLSVIFSKYHLTDQSRAPTSMGALEVSESDLSVGRIDELLTNENSLDATENQSPTEPNVMNPEANQLSLMSSKFDLADQLCSPTSMHTHEVLESNLSVGKIDDILTNETSDASNEEIAIKGSAPILLELTSPVGPEHFTMLPVRVVAHSNHQNGHSVLPEVAPAAPAHGLEFESEQKPNVFENSSGKVECAFGASNSTSEKGFSVVSGENTIVEMGFSSLSSSRGKEPLRLTEYLPENLSREAMFSHNSVELAGRVSDVSNWLPSSPSPVSADGSSRIIETMPLTVPSRKQRVPICETLQYDALKSSTDIGCSDESSCDFSHALMETIDLHDKVKLEESCVIVDDSELHAISSRARKLRSYKQRIQDAFTSKKRLAKEYEQLAIWFGDTDIGSSTETLSNMKDLQTHHACDSEWELL